MPVGIYKRTKKNSNKGKHLTKEWCDHIRKGNLKAIKEGRHKSWNKGLTKETDKRLMNTSKNLKGKISWSKGLTKENNSSLRHMSKLLKNHTTWNKGLKKDTDKRVKNSAEKLSKKLIGRKLSKKHCINIGKARIGKHPSIKIRKNMIKATAKRIFEGKQKLGTNGKYSNVVTYFYSKKNNKTFRTVSKNYELKCIKHLENDNNIVSYDMNCLAIRYFYKQKWHNYFPDFIVKVKKGKDIIIECKPSNHLNDEQVKIKIKAAKKYCKKNNTIFKVWTDETKETK